MRAMSVVLSHAVYLPSAQCFALVPLIDGLRRSGDSAEAELDYDFERKSVTVTASRAYKWALLFHLRLCFGSAPTALETCFTSGCCCALCNFVTVPSGYPVIDRAGEEVAVYDGRRNLEMVLATGTFEDDNPSNFTLLQVLISVSFFARGGLLQITYAVSQGGLFLASFWLLLSTVKCCGAAVLAGWAGGGRPAVHHEEADPGKHGPRHATRVSHQV